MMLSENIKILFGNHNDDLLDSPKTAFIDLASDRFKPEDDLAEKYRAFVGEILRLSLAGITVVAFLEKIGTSSPSVKTAACMGVILFGFGILFSLWFLYAASEGLRWYIAAFRYQKRSEKTLVCADMPDDNEKMADDLLKRRAVFIRACRWAKEAAAICLFLGSGCMVAAVVMTLSGN